MTKSFETEEENWPFMIARAKSAYSEASDAILPSATNHRDIRKMAPRITINNAFRFMSSLVTIDTENLTEVWLIHITAIRKVNIVLAVDHKNSEIL